MAIILNKGRITSTPSIPLNTSYERPSDWTDLPALSQGDEKVYLLVNVGEPDGSNYMRLKFRGDFTVDWGDGSTTNHATNTDADHEFLWANAPSNSLTSQGFRQVIVTVTPQAGSQLTEWILSSTPYVPADSEYNGSVNHGVCRVKMAGTNFTNMSLAMYFYTGLQEFEFIGTNNITNFSNTFKGSGIIKVTELDTSNGTNLNNMFASCNQLIEIPALDLSSSTNISYMFTTCTCITKLPKMTLPVSCTNLQYVFYNCYKLQEVPFTSFPGVTNFFGAFSGTAIREFNYSTPAITNAQQMFNGTTLLQTAILRDIPVGQFTNISYIFGSCGSLTYIKPFDTSGVINFRNCFSGIKHDMDLSWVDTSSGTNFEAMFKNSYLKDVSWLNVTSSATQVKDIFSGCSILVKLPTSMDLTNCASFNTSFYYCQSIRRLPTFINSGNITNLYRAFTGCFLLEEAPAFSGNQFTTVREAFMHCRSLMTAPQYDLSLIVSYPNSYNAFQSCYNLRKSLITTSKSEISYANCSLSRAEIVNIFNNLQTSVDNRTIFIASNPGSEDLTASDLLIATNKGWTVSS